MCFDVMLRKLFQKCMQSRLLSYITFSFLFRFTIECFRAFQKEWWLNYCEGNVFIGLWFVIPERFHILQRRVHSISLCRNFRGGMRDRHAKHARSQRSRLFCCLRALIWRIEKETIFDQSVDMRCYSMR